MNDTLKNLKTAISNVMERMFFLLPDPEDEGEVRPEEGFTVAIGITGEPRYRIVLLFDPVLAGWMTANALGGDAAKDGETVKRCLLEATNVIAGNFLHHGGGEREREITLPTLDRKDIFPGAAATETRSACLRFENRGVWVVIETAPEPR